MINKNFSVWEGVFETFEEVGGNLGVFGESTWINKQVTKANEYLDHVGANIPFLTSKDSPLPLVVSSLIGNKEEVSLLDFGGGMGFSYLETIIKVPKAKEKLSYFIVEGKETIGHLPDRFRNFPKLHFLQNLTDVSGNKDIFHLGTVLQYVDDWRGFLHSVCKDFSPKHIVFTDFYAGDIPTFVTSQIFYDQTIPYRMYNFQEVVDELSSCGYELTFKSYFESNVLGKKELPNSALPEAYRFDKTINCVFERV